MQNKILISISKQELSLLSAEKKLIKKYPCSTSKYGEGFLEGSNKTPLGKHKIAQKIGKDAPFAAIFSSRKLTGEIAFVEYEPIETGRDFITSRILWLNGEEDGINKGLSESGENIDSFKRYIYIHGTNEEGLIGKKASHGCIRLKNADIIELFELCEENMEVFIEC